VNALWLVVTCAASLGVWLVLPAGPERSRSRPSRALAARLAAAGIDMTPGRFRVWVGGASCATALVTLVATATPALAAVGAVAGAAAPYRWLTGRTYRRRRELREAWPEAIDLLTGAVRAGDSLPQAAARLAGQGPLLLRAPFETADRVYRSSGDFAAALHRLADLLADPVADRVAAALGLAKDLGGGHVVAVLARLGDTLRAELTVRREIEARRSWVVTSARAAAVAPWVVLGLFALRPGALAAYRNGTGAIVIAVGGLLTFCGYRLMLNVGRLPEEKRLV